MFLMMFLTSKTTLFKLFFKQVLDVNPKRMFWTITNGWYRIIGEHALNNFQDTILTLGIATSMANIVTKGVMMKEEPVAISHDLKYFDPIVESSFINLCDFFDENDPSLLDVVVHVSVNSRPVEE